MMTVEEMTMYDWMVDNGIATAEELNLAFNLTSNDWTKTIEDVLYIRTGYRTIEQFMEEE